MAARKKRAAKRVAPHSCVRCDGTGQYKTFGTCFACDGTGTTTKQQRAGASKWRGQGGGTVASLCRARRTVSYVSDIADTTLYCYNKEGHDTPHKFMAKIADRCVTDCGKPVAADAHATFPCAHRKGHSGDCRIASNVRDSVVATITAMGRQLQQAQDAAPDTDTRFANPLHVEPSAQPGAGWDITQRNDLDDLVDLFKG